MLLPALNKARARAKATACTSNEKQVGLVLTQYASDNRDMVMLRWNSGASWIGYYDEYAPNKNIFLCPAMVPWKWSSTDSYAAQKTYASNVSGKNNLWGSAMTTPNGNNGNICLKVASISRAEAVLGSRIPLIGEARASLTNDRQIALFDLSSSDGSYTINLYHNGRANVIMSDGHVESWIGKKFIKSIPVPPTVRGYVNGVLQIL